MIEQIIFITLRRLLWALVTGVLLGSVGCKNDASTPKKTASDNAVHRKLAGGSADGTLVEENENSGPAQVGGYTILPVTAPGFERLSKDQKKTLYDQFRRQHGSGNCVSNNTGSHDVHYCRVRRILEQIMLHPGGISVDIRHKVKAYLIQLWLHGSNINRITGKKSRATFIPGELGAATQLAIGNGADIDVSKAQNVPLDANNIEQLEALLQEIRPYIFDSLSGKNSAGNHRRLDSEGGGKTGKDTTTSPLRGVSPSMVGAESAETSAALEIPTTSSEYEDLLLYIEDPKFTDILKKLSKKAEFLDKKVREVGGAKSTATRVISPSLVVAQILHVGGDTGPIIEDAQDLLGFGASSLSGNQRILWLNVNEAFENHAGTAIARAFSASETMAQLRIERRQLVSVAYHALRQLAGFGADGTENKASDWLEKRLGENYLLFQELRADLAALYLCFNEEIRTTGLIPDKFTRNAVLAEYLMSALESIAAGVNPNEHAFLMARMVVLNYLIADGVVNAKSKGAGHLSVSIPNYGALRTSIVQLLGKVRNIRFFGDGAKAAELLNQFAYVQAGWTKELQRRFAKLHLGSRYGVLLPLLSKQSESKGALKATDADIVLTMPRSLYERQMTLARLK